MKIVKPNRVTRSYTQSLIAGPEDAIWMMTEHDPEHHRLEIIKAIPDIVVGRITIQLAAVEDGSVAKISYSFTSLGSDGDRVVREFTQEHFDEFMLTWETELNHFTATGERLTEN